MAAKGLFTWTAPKLKPKEIFSIDNRKSMVIAVPTTARDGGKMQAALRFIHYRTAFPLMMVVQDEDI
jgi:hypothetical protein